VRPTAPVLLVTLVVVSACVSASPPRPAASTPTATTPTATTAACPARPPAFSETRGAPAVAYDQALGALLLFGGRSAANAPLNDTWTWQHGCWTQRTPGTSPTPRSWMIAAFDPGRHVLVAYGGDPGGPEAGSFLFDTWAWDGANWSLVATTGPELFTPAISYDPATKTVILVGPNEHSLLEGPPCETWSWTGSAWQRLDPSSGPSQMGSPSLAPGPDGKGLILFGGPLAETWTWDGLTWTQRNVPGPPRRIQAAIALDELRHRVVLAGGHFGSAPAYQDTWLWDGAQWTQVPVAHFPTAIGPLVAVDTGQQVLLVDAAAEVLVWSGTDWGPS
jgi:hypothetical protein